MVRASRCVCVAVAMFVFSGCGQAKVEPTLDVTAKPRAVDNKGGKSTITVSAVDALGKAGTGKVTVTSSVGSLKAGESATLSGGSADFEFSCDLSADATCVGSAKIDASWSTTDGVKVTATTSISITAPAVPDAGKADAGIIVGGVVDGGTFGEYSIGLVFEKAVLLKDTGDNMKVSAKLVKTASPTVGVAGATVSFDATNGASFSSPAFTSKASAVTDATGTATVTLYVATASSTIVSAAAFDATAYQGIAVANVAKIDWVKTDPRTKSTLTVRSTGIDSSTTAFFKVTDSSDQPVVGADVSFEVGIGSAAGVTVSPSSRTDKDGIAKTNVASGEAKGPVSVRATVAATIDTPRPLLSIATFNVILGRASDEKLSVQCARNSLGALQTTTPPKPDQSTTCTASFADRNSNILPFPVDVTWLAEAGLVPNTTTSSGDFSSTVMTFQTKGDLPRDTSPFIGEPSNGANNPRDMFVSIVAAMKGEEQFFDGSGTDGGVANGKWDLGEWFVDLGEPFVDSNDNGVWDQSEVFIDTERKDCATGDKLPFNKSYDGPNGCWDGDTTIWRTAHIVYTGNFALLEFNAPTFVQSDEIRVTTFRWFDEYYNRVSNDGIFVNTRITAGTRGSIRADIDALGENFAHTLVYYRTKAVEGSNGVFTETGPCEAGDLVVAPVAKQRCIRRYRFEAWKTGGLTGTVYVTGPPANTAGPTATVFELSAGNALEAGSAKKTFTVNFPP